MKGQRKILKGAISATQRKLGHARDTFQRLQASTQAIPLDRELVERRLSDFLTAADSVVDIITQKGGQVHPRWVSTWWGKRDAADRDLKKFMTKQRNAETHGRGARVNRAQQKIPYEEHQWRIEARRPRRPPASDAMHTPYGPLGLGRPSEVQIDIFMLGDEEVTAKCGRYLGLLEQMVEDFGREHP
jgi:hypothetical protein